MIKNVLQACAARVRQLPDVVKSIIAIGAGSTLIIGVLLSLPLTPRALDVTRASATEQRAVGATIPATVPTPPQPAVNYAARRKWQTCLAPLHACFEARCRLAQNCVAKLNEVARTVCPPEGVVAFVNNVLSAEGQLKYATSSWQSWICSQFSQHVLLCNQLEAAIRTELEVLAQSYAELDRKLVVELGWRADDFDPAAVRNPTLDFGPLNDAVDSAARSVIPAVEEGMLKTVGQTAASYGAGFYIGNEVFDEVNDVFRDGNGDSTLLGWCTALVASGLADELTTDALSAAADSLLDTHRVLQREVHTAAARAHAVIFDRTGHVNKLINDYVSTLAHAHQVDLCAAILEWLDLSIDLNWALQAYNQFAASSAAN